ncbi:hypothetical protein LO872_000413 [Vibrio fluvialis]|nr:hypothetical protein [Vibrio fluvialis]
MDIFINAINKNDYILQLCLYWRIAQRYLSLENDICRWKAINIYPLPFGHFAQRFATGGKSIK